MTLGSDRSEAATSLASLLTCLESSRLLGRGFPRLPSDISLDAALDLRDAAVFDDRWMAAHHAIVALEKNSPAATGEQAEAARISELAFMRAFESSSSPDFSGYVSDDFELLSRALLVGYDSPWLTALFDAYSENRFPYGTLSESMASLGNSIQKAAITSSRS